MNICDLDTRQISLGGSIYFANKEDALEAAKFVIAALNIPEVSAPDDTIH